ncbi:MAG: HAD hydrolase-like protein [Rickettsiales bacterium]|jgi:FMN phosphatase YigB (HAD superfamily)|nr:HAD hydrolase-like protein [Rickettsiales bacterium]
MSVRNIIFDVDGVLVSVNRAYFEYLRSFPQYKDITFEDLPKICPISDFDGSFSLTQEFQSALPLSFWKSEFLYKRPIFEGVPEVLRSLKACGYRLFTMSAAFDPEGKGKWLRGLFGDLLMLGFSPPVQGKEQALRGLMVEYGMRPEETVFIDDRFSNIRAGLALGLHVVRMQPEFYLPLPPDLAVRVPVVRNMRELKDYVMGKRNKRGG